MKMQLTIRIVFGLLAVVPFMACGEHTPEEETRLVAKMLEFTMWYPDVMPKGRTFRVPNYGNPDVFYGVRTETPWTRAEKEAAFLNFVTNMWQLDFSPRTYGHDKPNPVAATYQCLRMNCTNAVPSIRRLVLNPTLDSHVRLKTLEFCIKLSPVDDDMTMFMGNVLTNETFFANDQRDYVLEYADKVYGAMVSNLADRAVCDRAALMVYNNYPRDDWQNMSHLDRFFANYFSGYAMSSNRLAFVDAMLSNTNVTEDVEMRFIKERFITITNQLHQVPQPLPQVSIGGGNE